MISAWDVSGAHLEMVGLKAKCISKREKLIWLAKSEIIKIVRRMVLVAMIFCCNCSSRNAYKTLVAS